MATSQKAMHRPPGSWRCPAATSTRGGGWTPRAHQLYARQLEIARTLGDRLRIADALFNKVHTEFLVNPDAVADLQAMRDEAASIFRELGEDDRLARLTWTSSYPLAFTGHIDEARQVITETLVVFEREEDEFYIALVSAAMGGIALMERDIPTAIRFGLRSVQANQAMGDMASITLMLRAAAAAWMIAGRAEDAAMLLGAFEGHCRRYGVRPPMNPDSFLALGGPLDELFAALEQPALASARARGEAMSTDAVIDFMVEHAADLTSEPTRT